MKKVFRHPFTAIFSLLLLTGQGGLMAQTSYNVKGNMHPRYLVERILLAQNNEMLIENVDYIGNLYSLGAFSNPSKYNIIKKGLILSTGHVNSSVGPNYIGNASTKMQQPGNKRLSTLAAGPTLDACILSFDFTTSADSILFRYYFGSEEYPEYVNKDVNDIFVFDLIDMTTGERKNLAVVGKNKDMVTVDHVNEWKNAEYYIENDYWRPNNISKYKDDPGRGDLALNYQFDGFTTLMTAGSKVVRGRKYKIVFAIADVGDDIYDSAVFLEAGSFEAIDTEQKEGEEDLKNIQKELTDQSIKIKQKNQELILTLDIHFEFDSDQMTDEQSIDELNAISRVLRLQNEIMIEVQGHTDGMGSREYNTDLSERRAETVRSYMESMGITSDRLSAVGFADQVPISDNITNVGRAKNRRVELHLRIKN